MHKLRQIKVFGDTFKVRKTYDIDDFGIGRYGFDIYSDSNKLLCYFVGDSINELKQYIKMIFYKNYEGAYSYYK